MQSLVLHHLFSTVQAHGARSHLVVRRAFKKQMLLTGEACVLEESVEQQALLLMVQVSAVDAAVYGHQLHIPGCNVLAWT